jgi:[NiFe] hydrogenase diaphorase moiety large subunit
LLKQYLEKVMQGKGEPADLKQLKELGEVVKLASRCGLGQTSPNPILSSLEKFGSVYESLVKEDKAGMQPAFDIRAVLADSESIAGRKSVHFTG